MIKEFMSFSSISENLSLFIATKRRLRDAIHDIMFDELDPGEEMSTSKLSERLKDRYNIDISSKILDKLIFDEWWKKDNYSIFREKDKKWLDVWPYKKVVEIKKKKDSSFGKGRKKIEKEESRKKWRREWNKNRKWNKNYPYYDDGIYYM